MVDQLLAPVVAAKAVTEDEVDAYKFTFSRRGKAGDINDCIWHTNTPLPHYFQKVLARVTGF